MDHAPAEVIDLSLLTAAQLVLSQLVVFPSSIIADASALAELEDFGRLLAKQEVYWLWKGKTALKSSDTFFVPELIKLLELNLLGLLEARKDLGHTLKAP